MPIEIEGVEIGEILRDQNIGEVRVDGTLVWQSKQIIEDWEDYNSTSELEENWTTDGTGSYSLESGGLIGGSTQHVRQHGFHQMRSFPSGGNHPSTLDRYFESGDVVEIPFNLNSVNDPQYNFLVNLEDDTAEGQTANWRLELQTDSGLRIVYHDGSGRDVRATENDSPPYSTSEVYRARIGVSPSQVTWGVYREDGSTKASISTTDVSSGEVASEMSIGQLAGGGGDWEIDEWRVV